MTRFPSAINEQIANEFAASQQYIANAVHYDAETLPRLAAFFYAQALEERNHAMMMVQYLLDADVEVEMQGPLGLRRGDALVLSTDGLTRQVTPQEIRKLAVNRTPRLACEELISLANERGDELVHLARGVVEQERDADARRGRRRRARAHAGQHTGRADTRQPSG